MSALNNAGIAWEDYGKRRMPGAMRFEGQIPALRSGLGSPFGFGGGGGKKSRIGIIGVARRKDAYPRHLRCLLRTRGERPRRRAAEKRDVIAAVQWIEFHLLPQPGSPRHHTALVRVKSGARCNVGFCSGV